MRLLLAPVVVLFLWIAFAQKETRQANAGVGDNGLATNAELNAPLAIAVDGSQTLYIAEFLGVIRRVDLKTGIITTLHTSTKLELMTSLAVDTAGNLLAAEHVVDRVRRINPTTGSVTTIAGGRRLQFGGDGGPALDAGLSSPHYVVTDANDNLYIVDLGDRRVRRVDAHTGIITTVAGNGKCDSSGDGGPALGAGLEYPNSIALDRDGNLFIAQYGYGQDSHRIRRVDTKSGIITTVAGLAKEGLTGDGGPAPSASLTAPSDLLFDRMGDLYVVASDRVRYIEARTRIITTIAGSTKGFAGDGGPAIKARFDSPSSVAMDADGNLYIADYMNNRIRRVNIHTGVIQTVAGNGLPHEPRISL